MHGPKYRAEFRGGLNREAIAAIRVLQGHWPVAFPKKSRLVRPLSGRVIAPIAAGTGWSKRYTVSVVGVWKRRRAYSESVLRHERRYDLTGAVTDEIIGDRARERALANLARLSLARIGNGEGGERAPDEIPADFITVRA